MMEHPDTISINILEIEALEVNVENHDYWTDRPRLLMYATCTFRCRLRYTHPITGETMVAVNMSAESRGVDNMVIVRTAIENFLNKDYSNIRTDYYDTNSKCHIDRNRIDAIECNWDNQEMKDLFMYLFSASNWSLENKTLTC